MYQNGTEVPEINHMFYNNKPTHSETKVRIQTNVGGKIYATWSMLMSDQSVQNKSRRLYNGLLLLYGLIIYHV